MKNPPLFHLKILTLYQMVADCSSRCLLIVFLGQAETTGNRLTLALRSRVWAKQRFSQVTPVNYSRLQFDNHLVNTRTASNGENHKISELENVYLYHVTV
ncbi:hypothetical protein CDAR_480491 [Caerostris darwini]|uniref:Secreted protein n=1 Tax=Caerostris darwini TaxID=1538125 RepID=A0AAV4V296_9ARAC|nr:hypothetical protein CDAR_480491 [Caerostris darwini]